MYSTVRESKGQRKDYWWVKDKRIKDDEVRGKNTEVIQQDGLRER